MNYNEPNRKVLFFVEICCSKLRVIYYNIKLHLDRNIIILCIYRVINDVTVVYNVFSCLAIIPMLHDKYILIRKYLFFIHSEYK